MNIQFSKRITGCLVGCAICASALLTSCSGDDQLTDTRVTYYVNLDLQGDEVTITPLGAAYNDAGCKADLNGQDYTDKVRVDGSVDTNALGLYTLTYTAVNPDGFSAQTQRTVIVYDPAVTTSIAGTYSTDMDATIYLNNGKTFSDQAAYYGNTSECTGIIFNEVAPGVYYVSDIFGGWYAQIRAYGARYAMTGYIALNPDNTLQLLDSYIAGWGDGLDYIEDAVYDPETGKISYSLSYAGQIFMSIVLNKD